MLHPMALPVIFGVMIYSILNQQKLSNSYVVTGNNYHPSSKSSFVSRICNHAQMKLLVLPRCCSKYLWRANSFIIEHYCLVDLAWIIVFLSLSSTEDSYLKVYTWVHYGRWTVEHTILNWEFCHVLQKYADFLIRRVIIRFRANTTNMFRGSL